VLYLHLAPLTARRRLWEKCKDEDKALLGDEECVDWAQEVYVDPS
jgi:hypothetical protein